jgi:hypothetical protein
VNLRSFVFVGGGGEDEEIIGLAGGPGSKDYHISHYHPLTF